MKKHVAMNLCRFCHKELKARDKLGKGGTSHQLCYLRDRKIEYQLAKTHEKQAESSSGPNNKTDIQNENYIFTDELFKTYFKFRYIIKN